ncbi:MAG: hypothetical protein V4631_05060 [Pseudomonadota bacterium]
MAAQNYENNHFYSPRYSQLAELWAREETLRKLQIDFDSPDLHTCAQDYEYPVAGWPVIISAARVAEFENLVGRLPALFRKAMQLYFGDDAAAFADYLQVPAVTHAILAAAPFEPRGLLNRHDLLFAQGELKLIEVNAGSTIGGWQLDYLESMLRAVLAQGGETARWSLYYRNVIDAMIKAIFGAIALLRAPAGGNVLLVTGDLADLGQLVPALREAFARLRPTALSGGALLVCDDHSEISFGVDGTAWCQGLRVDAVMLLMREGEEVKPALNLRLVSAHMAGHLVMPDSPLCTIYGNKTLMALVHEPALAPLLSAEERDLVARNIPYTTRLRESTLEWAGEQWSLRPLLLARKDDFVIKKSHSLQGRDVYIGKYCTSGEWNDVVERLFGEPDWLAQQFFPADHTTAPDAQGEMIDWAFVWGVFDAGQRYGGAFVRGMPVRNGKGVINSAQGATEYAVFEEMARKNKVTI